MKRIIALMCVAVLTAALLCGCMDSVNNMANDVRNKASEVADDMRTDPTRYSNDNNGLLDDNRETYSPTEDYVDNTDGIMTEEGNFSEEWNDMVEDGEVEDGDGNVGELENRDGDANVDEEAAEYAQEQVSADENDENN